QTRSLSFGSRKTCAPLEPCCFRFSAPLVEKVFQKRSKSSIFAVARTIVFSSVGRCRCAIHPTPLHHELERRSDPAPGRVHPPSAALPQPSGSRPARAVRSQTHTSRKLTLTLIWRRECLHRSECFVRSAESFGSSSSSLLCLCSLAFSRPVDNR